MEKVRTEVKKILFGLLAILMVFGITIPSSMIQANELVSLSDEELSDWVELDGELLSFEDDSLLVMDGTQTLDEEKAMWEEFTNYPNIEYLIILDPYLINEEFEIVEEFQPQERILRRFRVNNVRNLADQNGAVFSSTSGTPGMNLTLNVSRSVANTVSSRFGASNNAITAEVGFSVTGTRTVSQSTSMTVPSRHNSRNVNRMTINARPIMQRRSFRVQIGGEWRTEGTGTASRPIGVAFSNSFTFR